MNTYRYSMFFLVFKTLSIYMIWNSCYFASNMAIKIANLLRLFVLQCSWRMYIRRHFFTVALVLSTCINPPPVIPDANTSNNFIPLEDYSIHQKNTDLAIPKCCNSTNYTIQYIKVGWFRAPLGTSDTLVLKRKIHTPKYQLENTQVKQ
jgi:hypothetical protein